MDLETPTGEARSPRFSRLAQVNGPSRKPGIRYVLKDEERQSDPEHLAQRQADQKSLGGGSAFASGGIVERDETIFTERLSGHPATLVTSVFGLGGSGRFTISNASQG